MIRLLCSNLVEETLKRTISSHDFLDRLLALVGSEFGVDPYQFRAVCHVEFTEVHSRGPGIEVQVAWDGTPKRETKAMLNTVAALVAEQLRRTKNPSTPLPVVATLRRSWLEISDQVEVKHYAPIVIEEQRRDAVAVEIVGGRNELDARGSDGSENHAAAPAAAALGDHPDHAS